jgi:N-acetyl-D-muramate 6-phosphate phosphatase
MFNGHFFTGIEAVLFDLDGTLLDSAPDLASAADQMRIQRGLPSLPLAQYRPMVGSGARGMIGVAFGTAPSDTGFEALRDEFFSNYQQCLAQRTQPFEDIAALIGALLARGLPWGVVTNKSSRFTDPLTSAMPLFASAGAIISGDTMPHAKPHPAPLLEAARRIGIPADRCIYVGDDERDITAGRAASMGTVVARYGYLGIGTIADEWQADASIEAPLQLLALLQ